MTAVPFFGRDVSARSVSLIEAETDRSLRYGELAMQVDEAAERLPTGRSVVFIALTPTIDSIVTYLAALARGHVVLPLPRDASPSALEDLRRRYRPATAVGFPFEGDDASRSAPFLHPDLRLLLRTSGSTGSPKVARLSAQAIIVNATDIAVGLGIDGGSVGITSLPLHYSYGLSILHSHLAAGATVVLSGASALEREFWRVFDRHRCDSFAGVPHSYEMLERLRFDASRHPSLRSMTQAGGRLSPQLVEHFARALGERGRQFFVMYGQTEATARMAILPPDLAVTHPDAAGVAVRSGAFSIVDDEVVFRGPNVMMGYAASIEDLERGDDLGGTLYTGDLGAVDGSGVVYLRGRRSRIAKIDGIRVDLDDVENMISAACRPAAVAHDNMIVLYFECDDRGHAAATRSRIAGVLGVHHSRIVTRLVPHLPRTDAGKPDYGRLACSS